MMLIVASKYFTNFTSHFRAHFNYDQPERGELPFKKSEVFHVVDTLHNGVVGSWQAFKVDPYMSGNKSPEQVHRGVIPNKARSEELATRQFNAAKKEQNVSDSKGTSIFRRRRDKGARQRRSKSLGKVIKISVLIKKLVKDYFLSF
jgi:tight junction protein 1